MNLTDFFPLLVWLNGKTAQLSAYLARWVDMLDPGQD